MLDTNAVDDVGAREHLRSISWLAMYQRPRHERRGEMLAADFDPTNASVRACSAGPKVVFARTINESFEPLAEPLQIFGHPQSPIALEGQ